ncbi:hypothetical protein PVAP13_5NG560500 [Panicum virgatum]|uniref:Uncharacterized protein n=1 Tax=Panicum virgatum TaxID=38727 RepID=A0A8T0S2Z7_PANVG|nr:hypothetical protein PVAP13_5NG560500 [Panicum virgatum]
MPDIVNAENPKSVTPPRKPRCSRVALPRSTSIVPVMPDIVNAAAAAPDVDVAAAQVTPAGHAASPLSRPRQTSTTPLLPRRTSTSLPIYSASRVKRRRPSTMLLLAANASPLRANTTERYTDARHHPAGELPAVPIHIGPMEHTWVRPSFVST